MGTQSINNIRNSISHTPKSHEWEARFFNLGSELQSIVDGLGLNTELLTVLQETATLPGITVGDTTAQYKGAIVHYGSRADLSGALPLNFKEVKGSNDVASWLIRRFIKAWVERVDSFQGQKTSVANYKAGLELAMQDENGDPFYRVRYFGLFPTTLDPQNLTWTLDNSGQYPIVGSIFSYDYWRDSYDPEFGQ